VAKELGISRTTLWRKMKKYRIDAEDQTSQAEVATLKR
jgi:DNA-binding NtrC family response regulator